jgi:hypothetical protein
MKQYFNYLTSHKKVNYKTENLAGLTVTTIPESFLAILAGFPVGLYAALSWDL